MASTINAKTTGVGGIDATGDASGVLALQTGGTTAITIDASQVATFVNGISTPNTFAFKNRLINSQLLINQRGVSGTVTLSAGAYGHDRFKAGASGCTYTFATANNVTILTISAGSLQQVVEGLNLESGTYTLSWTGTVQGKFNGGSYSASGITGSITGGTNTTVEFNTGTLSLSQLEKNSTATSFDYRPYSTELSLCNRYYVGANGVSYFTAGYDTSYTTINSGGLSWDYQMRTTPTIIIVSGAMDGHHAVAPTVRSGPVYYGVGLQFSGSGLRTGANCSASVIYTLSAEL